MATAPVELERRLTVQKVGHLRVDKQGEVTYKKTPSSTLMASLQLGLSHSIGSLEPKPRRDILMKDFDVVETVDFPSNGSDVTQAHKYKDFTFTTYSPVAFRYFREEFQIKAEDYLMALCHQPLRELSNPGASGSLFYLSADDEFIMKTVQKKEAKFLQKLLPGYYLNLTQNKKTLLPKFFGLYQYRCGGTKIRIVVMNNLLPSSLKYHYKFDLKGSTYKRRASGSELEKLSPTYKDNDFTHLVPEGLILSVEKYEIVTRTLQRDCQVLESFGIMDYSLLLGVFNVDEAIRSGDPPPTTPTETMDSSGIFIEPAQDTVSRDRLLHPQQQSRIEARKNFSIISAETTPEDIHEIPPNVYPDGYIQARFEQGDRLLLYVGVIDILQSYRLKKRLEHGFKSIITDGDTVSVHNPSFYSQRFQVFMKGTIFKREKVKIRPRRNSIIPSSKSLRRSGGSQPGGGGTPGTNKGTIRQDSIEQKESPFHNPRQHTPSNRGASPVVGMETSPIVKGTGPRPMIVELSEVEVEVNEQMNTSTPTNDTVDIGVTTPVVTPITSTASVIVTGNRRVSSDSERDQLENELETLRKKLAHTEKKLLEISPSEKILYENENSV